MNEQLVNISRNKNFICYIIATLSTGTVYGIKYVAFTWLAIQIDPNAFSVAAVLIAETIPQIFFAPFIGVYVDRLNKKHISIFVNLFQAASIAILPFLYYSGSLTIWHIFLVSALIAIMDVMYKATRMTFIRELVPDEALLTANYIRSIVDQAGMMLGAVIAGYMLTVSSPVNPLIAQIGILLLGVIMYASISKNRYRSIHSSQVTHTNIHSSLKSTFNYINTHRNIIPVYVIMYMLISTLILLNVLLPLFADFILNVGSAGFGLIESAFAVGAMVGGCLLIITRNKFNTQHAFNIGMSMLIACILLFSSANSLMIAIILYFLIGASYQVWIINMTSAQKLIDINHQGRIHSIFTAGFNMFAVIFYLLIAYLSELISIRYIYILQALFILVVWAGIYAYKRHNLEKRNECTS